MAGKNLYPESTHSSPKACSLSFYFAPNFTSTVSTIKPGRGVTSITRTAAGIWSINLDAPYYALTGFSAIRMGANLGGLFTLANVSDVVRGYTGNTVIQLRHDISGTATDIAAASTNAVFVRMQFSDSSIGF